MSRLPVRKSLSLMERNVNTLDDNLTLPVTKSEKRIKRGVSLGGEALSSSSSWDHLSDLQKLRRTAQPRKSILKPRVGDESADTPPNQPSNASHDLAADTIDFGTLYAHMAPSGPRAPRASMPVSSIASSSSEAVGRPSLGPRRRVSFAPAAHVRMFEEKVSKAPRRKSSMGPRVIAQSPTRSSHSAPNASRRSSIQAPARTVPESPRPRPGFVGEGEEEGEASMDIESDGDGSFDDDTANSDDIVAEAAMLSREESAGHPDGSSSPADDDEDDDGEMDMDETVIGGGIIYEDTETDTDDESDMELTGTDEAEDEEKTMDFTVALGGPMPSAPPQGALRSRASIGYSNPAAPGGSLSEPLLPGEGGDESSMEMEETTVYGGVYNDESLSSGDDTNGTGAAMDHTATYNYNGTAMSFTTVGGGINANVSADGSGMDFTTVGGVINRTATYSQADASGMDFTTVGGGINRTSMYSQADASGLDFTTVGGGIVQTMTYTETDETEMDFTTAIGGIAGQSVHQSTATYTRNIFAPENMGEHTMKLAVPGAPLVLPPVSPIRVPSPPPAAPSAASTGRATPGPISPSRGAQGATGATPKSTPRRPRASTAAGSTPSFARPTASSAQKSKDAAAPRPSSAAKAGATKKRNIFAASPETPGTAARSRSRSRSPTKSMEKAASVAKRLSFAPSATSTPAAQRTAPAPRTSSGTKRAHEDDDEDEENDNEPPPSAKKMRLNTSAHRDATMAVDTTVNIFAVASESSEEMEQVEQEDADAKSHDAEPTPTDEAPPDEPEDVAAHEEADMAEDDEVPELDDDEAAVEDDLVDADEEDPAYHSPERPLPQYTPRKSLFSGPRPSLGTPMRNVQLSGADAELVRRSMGVASPASGASDSDDASEGDSDDGAEAEPPHTAMADFLDMVGIEFMDTLWAQPPRRSSVGRVLRDRKSEAPSREYDMSAFTEARVESLFLNMYSWGLKQLRSKIRERKEELESTERIYNDENPMVVRDYLSAPEDEKELFKLLLNQYQDNVRHEKKSEWYDWRQQMMDEIVPLLESMRAEMRKDAERFTKSREVATTLLPDLRKRQAELAAELAAHRAAVAEIEVCDKDELKELKAAVVEQNTEIERFAAELDEKTTRIADLDTKLASLKTERAEHMTALDAARSMCDKFTPSDVLRLENEFASLQALHDWRVVRVGTSLELEYARELALSVPCRDGVPDIPAATLTPTAAAAASPATTVLLNLTVAALAHLRPKTAAALVRATGQLWTAVRRVRGELDLVTLHYPTTYDEVQADADAPKLKGKDSKAPVLKCTASIMVPAADARVRLHFMLGQRALLSWRPEEVVVSAEVVYGSCHELERIATEALENAPPGVPGMLLQACAEVAGSV